MSQTEYRSQKSMMEAYKAKHLENIKVEWLIEHGKIRQSVYFKGAIGDRYTIYVATKRSKNIVDFHTVYNGYDYGTNSGEHIATIKDYILKMVNVGGRYWNNSTGHTIKQLMRQGVVPRSNNKRWKIRYCRSAYFMKTCDKVEFNPWLGMKVNLLTGKLVNKPAKHAIIRYNKAKETDRKARKANRIANKNNSDANARYLNADGDFSLLPIDDVFKLRNTDRRNDILNFHGLEKILSTLKSKVEDEDTIDGRLYKLLNVYIPDESSGQERHSWCLYLQMINPSTGESHFEGIPNVDSRRGWNSSQIGEATVKAALSWRDGDGLVQSGRVWNATSSSSNYVAPVKMT